MQVKVTANELKNADISLISLVKHAATRSPFRILKSEDLVQAQDHNSKEFDTLADKVSSLLKSAQTAKIVGVFCAKDKMAQVAPILKAVGLEVKADATEMLNENVAVFKYDGYKEDGVGTILALNEHVLVGFDRVMKSFMPFPSGTDFDENVAASSFFPSLYHATEALHTTICAAMDRALNSGEAVEKIDTILKAFRAHVVSLAKMLPVTVFKFEKALQDSFESSTVTNVSGSEPVTKSAEDGSMSTSKTILKEAVSGDLDGLLTTQTPAPVVEAAKPADTAPAVVVKEAAPAPVVVAETIAPVVETAAPVVAPAVVVVKEDSDLEKIMKAMKILADSMIEMKNQVTKQDELIASLSKANTEAIEKANQTVVTIVDDLDQSLATLQGKKAVKKDGSKVDASDSGIWKGVLPGIVAHATGTVQ